MRKNKVGKEAYELNLKRPRRKPSLSRKKQRITLIALFGVAVFISKVLLPSSMDKY